MTDQTTHASIRMDRAVSMKEVEARIISEHYFTALNGVSGALLIDGCDEDDVEVWSTDCDKSVGAQALSKLMLCVLVLPDTTVTGEAFCPEFDLAAARQAARADALGKAVAPAACQ